MFVVKADRTVEMRNVKVGHQLGEEMVLGCAGGRAGGCTDGHLRLTPGAHVTTGTRGQGSGAPPEGGREGGGERGGRSGRRGREGNQS